MDQACAPPGLSSPERRPAALRCTNLTNASARSHCAGGWVEYTRTQNDANKNNKARRGKDDRKGTSTMTNANKKGEHGNGSVSEPPSSKLN